MTAPLESPISVEPEGPGTISLEASIVEALGATRGDGEALYLARRLMDSVGPCPIDMAPMKADEAHLLRRMA